MRRPYRVPQSRDPQPVGRAAPVDSRNLRPGTQVPFDFRKRE